MKTYLLFIIVIIFAINISAQNYSLQFDGVDDYGKTTQVANVSNNFTIEFWAKPTAEDVIIIEGNADMAFSMVLHPPHGLHNWGAGHAGVGITVATNMITVNEHSHQYTMSNLVWEGTIGGWNHIAVVFENKTPRLYVNGTLVRTGLTSSYDYVHPSLGYDGYPSYTANSGIGTGMSGAKYEGYLDEMRISDIIRYNNNFTSPFSFNNDANTISLYHFNEGTGNIITDESSNSNNGILDGPIWSSDVPNGSASSILMQAPNGGEVWQIGSNQNILWASSNVIDVKIELSINNGASWTEVISSKPSTGLYSWSVPNNPSFQCLIKISDVTDPNVNDISDNVFTIEQPTSIEAGDKSGIPTEFILQQNFPNPFNPNTTIYYGIPEGSYVKLSIYNLLGEKIAELVNDYKDAGNYSTTFNFENHNSGVYLYRIQAGNFVETKKMILMK